jgi:alcohol dehydrogenase
MYLQPHVPMPLREMYFKGITFMTGRPNVRPPMEHVLSLCRSGCFAPDVVPTTLFEFSDAPEAWASAALRTAVSRIPGSSAKE